MNAFLAPFSRPLPAAIFIAFALMLDQAIKLAVELYLPLHEVDRKSVV